MARVGCYICNFNGKDYVINCIASVLGQKEISDDFRLYVVDNASTDGSVEAVHEKFGDKVEVIQNAVNLGGAGGFNRGLQHAQQCNYDYVVLLDNDIVVGDGCIDNLIRYIDSDRSIGCVGTKIMIMDRPEYIQEFGGQLDWEKYDLIKDYWYEQDTGTEDVIESDWVSSCALIARVDAVRKTTLFPEENFLFWDDIDFTYQFKMAGYKVMSLASAKVYHKGKKKPVTNTALGYYGMRNRVKFFARYEKQDRLPYFCKSILDQYFQTFFGSASKGFLKANSSRMFALDDFVHKHYGRIDDGKLYEMDEKKDSLYFALEGVRSVQIEYPEDESLLEAVGVLCRRLDDYPEIKKTILVDAGENCQQKKAALKKYYENEIEVSELCKSDGLVMKPCTHFREVHENIYPRVWFDKYLNCIVKEDEYYRVQAFPYMKEFFINMFYEWLMTGILKERTR